MNSGTLRMPVDSGSSLAGVLQQALGASLPVLTGPPTRASVRDAPRASFLEKSLKTHKACSKCGTTKPMDDFHRSAKSSDGKASWCKRCANTWKGPAKKRIYNKANKRRWQLKTRYGLTPDQVSAMWQAQGCKCALCDATPERFHIDHCHNTNRVRGLLCHRCNIRLGGWDDLSWRAGALAYLGLNDNRPPEVAEAA